MPTRDQLIAYLGRLIQKKEPLTNLTLIRDVHFRMDEMRMQLEILERENKGLKAKLEKEKRTWRVPEWASKIRKIGNKK